MRAPLVANPSDLDSVPDRPAVFLLWASEGKPYLARTALLRRRLRRLLAEREPYWVSIPGAEDARYPLQGPDEYERIRG